RAGSGRGLRHLGCDGRGDTGSLGVAGGRGDHHLCDGPRAGAGGRRCAAGPARLPARTGHTIPAGGGRLMALLLLAGAILAAVTGTVSLRMAATGSRRWFLPVAVSYLLAFTLLSAALGHGMGIAVAYGIWSATGVAITAVLSKIGRAHV